MTIEDSLDQQLTAFEAAGDFNRHEVLVAARDALAHLEAAISLGAPERVRGYVSDSLLQELAAICRDLAQHGTRRVHGSFDVVHAVVHDAESPAAITVWVDAVSSFKELGGDDALVAGSDELLAWTQELRMQRAVGPRAQPWIIASLGPLDVHGPVSGPAGTPMDPAVVAAMEAEWMRREREADEHAGALMRAASFMHYTAR